jgi:hypothetical protein
MATRKLQYFWLLGKVCEDKSERIPFSGKADKFVKNVFLILEIVEL